MAKVITYKGSTIYTTATTGRGWLWDDGIVQREIDQIRMPVGDGEYGKDLGESGADHKLTCQYIVASASAITTLLATWRNLQSATPGTLALPDGRTYSNCWIKDPTVSVKKRLSSGYLIAIQSTVREAA